MTPETLWQRFREHRSTVPTLGLSLDISRMHFADDFLSRMAPTLAQAFAGMKSLEQGAIANPDENRMVGHYWLRNPDLAPTPEIAGEIRRTITDIKAFAASVHAGQIKPPTAPQYTRILCIGIGGSALGPMFVADALGDPATDRMQIDFIDNTDPDGIDRTLRRLAADLPSTLCIVASKSGGTPETRNGMLLVAEAFRAAGLEFAKQAVAITMPGSRMDQIASSEGWLARFPMYDWVGGRTSELSAVGLLPAALQGIDIEGLLDGAKQCDAATRTHDLSTNPAAMMALMWYHATDGRGRKDMVVLPYKDRLLLFSRYLQQLIMESLGKEYDLQGNRVEQGLTVYGNKGSTDQHAYVQQLREGVPNFFAVFVRVLEEGGSQHKLDAGSTAGDYLHGFLLGTRSALFENGRESMTITIPRVDAQTVGALIALFERAVGLYAGLIGINAYHQPGVEAGKKAAADVLGLQEKIIATLTDEPQTVLAIAKQAANAEDVEAVFLILEHLSANGRAKASGGTNPGEMMFQC